MSRRCKDYYDDTDSDVDMPRSGRGSRSAASRKGGGDFGMRIRKEASRPWSQEESEWLIHVVSKTSTNFDNINWQDVAKQVPGRTGKQCREKWKNDLRPNICKDPWSLKEEYVLAMAHSLHGNRWSEVAKYLPTRPENTIKNRWYATSRAKAEVKIRTFLWLYSDLVDRQSFPAGPEAIDKARDLYRQLPDVVPLEEFEVPVDFYIATAGNDGTCPAALDTRPEIKIIGRGKAKPHVPGSTTAGGNNGTGGGGCGASPPVAPPAARSGAAASRATRASTAAAASVAAAVSPASLAAAAAGGVGNRGGGGHASGGGGHSEGDANCYVKVGGLAGDLPLTGPVKTTLRKRKGPGGGPDGDTDAAVELPLQKLVKLEHKTMDALGPLAAAGGDAAATVSTRLRVSQGETRASMLAGGAHMVARSPSASATLATAAGGALPVAAAARGGSSGGAALVGGHGSAALDPELLWQTAMEPYNNSLAQKGNHRMGHNRVGGTGRGGSGGGGGHMHPSAGMYGHPGGGGGADPDTLQSLFMMGNRMVGSEGGGSGGGASAADLSLFQLGPNTLHGILEDGGGGGNENDQDLLALTDGLDLASLTALIGGHDGEAASDCSAHDAMAGLAADVLSSQLPEPSTPHQMSHQVAHQMHHHQHSHTVTTPPPQVHHNPHQQPHYHHSHSQQQGARPHATSLGSAQSAGRQQSHPLSHPHSMSQGSYPQQQQHESQLPIQSRGSMPMPPSSQPQSQGQSDMSQHQQQMQMQMQHQQQQQLQEQQQMQAAHDAAAGGHSYMSYHSPSQQRRMPAAGTLAPQSRLPPPPSHHNMSHMYGTPYMSPHPSSAPPPSPAPPPSMHLGRAMHPSGPHPSPSPVKYNMAPSYGAPPPPYGVAGPPPPQYMMPMNVRGGYYKVPGSRPAIMPRGMMPYSPYGMPVYPHSMSGYMDPQQSQSLGGAGPGGDGGGQQQQQPPEPCTPGGNTPPGGGGGMHSVMGPGSAGGVEPLAGMGMGMGRAYGDVMSPPGSAPGGGQSM